MVLLNELGWRTCEVWQCEIAEVAELKTKLIAFLEDERLTEKAE